MGEIRENVEFSPKPQLHCLKIRGHWLSWSCTWQIFVENSRKINEYGSKLLILNEQYRYKLECVFSAKNEKYDASNLMSSVYKTKHLLAIDISKITNI